MPLVVLSRFFELNGEFPDLLGPVVTALLQLNGELEGGKGGGGEREKSVSVTSHPPHHTPHTPPLPYESSTPCPNCPPSPLAEGAQEHWRLTCRSRGGEQEEEEEEEEEEEGEHRSQIIQTQPPL